MKSTTEILELLRTYKAHSAAKYGVKRLGILAPLPVVNRQSTVMSTSATKEMLLHSSCWNVFKTN